MNGVVYVNLSQIVTENSVFKAEPRLKTYRNKHAAFSSLNKSIAHPLNPKVNKLSPMQNIIPPHSKAIDQHFIKNANQVHREMKRIILLLHLLLSIRQRV